jgi:hypothetical protein
VQAPEPARYLAEFHRIAELDLKLVDVIAIGALERSEMKAGAAGGDPCQLRYCFAVPTWWPVKKRAHDAVLTSGGSTTLSVTGSCRNGR